MLRRLLAVSLVLGLAVGLWLWSSRKDDAQLRYEQAYAVEQKAGADQAESLYWQLLADYPDSEIALLARKRLAVLERDRKQQQVERQAAYAAVKSVRQVVESYQSLYKRWPQSLKDFDDGAFLFDSAYLAESVGEGHQVYLALSDQPAGYRLWCFPGSVESGYLLNGKGRPLVAVNRSEALTEIEADYQVEEQKGALTFLLPRS